MLKYYYEIERIIKQEMGISQFGVESYDSVNITIFLLGLVIKCNRDITPQQFREKFSEMVIEKLHGQILVEEAKKITIENKINSLKRMQDSCVDCAADIIGGGMDSLQPMIDVVKKTRYF